MNRMKNIAIFSLLSSLVAFTINLLGKYIIFNLPGVVHISDTDAFSNTKIISKEISLLLSFNDALQKIGWLFLVLTLISTGMYLYQRYYNS